LDFGFWIYKLDLLAFRFNLCLYLWLYFSVHKKPSPCGRGT